MEVSLIISYLVISQDSLYETLSILSSWIKLSLMPEMQSRNKAYLDLSLSAILMGCCSEVRLLYREPEMLL